MTELITWAIVAAAGGAALVGALAFLLRRHKLGEARARWHDQTTGPSGAMFNALFLAAFALCGVIAWQNYQHASADLAAENNSVRTLYTVIGAMPDGDRLRAEVVDYASAVVTDEWPLMAAGRSSPLVTARLDGLYADIIADAPTDDTAGAARSEAVKQWENVLGARQARLADATSAVPVGLLVWLAVMGVALLAHALLVGLPHAASSLVPLLAESAVVAAAIVAVILLRQPYHGPLAFGPDQLRTLLSGPVGPR